MDVVFVLLFAVFFALSIGFVKLAERV